MKNETKKTYVAPKIVVVEIDHQGDLLTCSNGECMGEGGTFGLNYENPDIGHV